MQRIVRYLLLLGAIAGSARVGPAQAVVLEDAQLRPVNATLNDDFGGDVVLEGGRAFVAMRDTDRVQVFDLAGGIRFEAELTPPDGIPGDWFGFSIDASANRCVVGAPRHDAGVSGAGAAYVYAFDGSAWSFEQKLVAGDRASGDDFGWSVAMSGDTVVIGAPRCDFTTAPDQGASYVFGRSGTNWSETDKLTGSDSVAGDWFGVSVDLEGDLLAVCAEQADAGYPYSGAVYLSRRVAGNWQAEHKIGPSVPGGTFGHRLDIDGERLAVGMPYGGTSGAGVAIVYERVSGTWDSGFVCEVPYGAGLDQLGTDVALHGDRLVAGSIFDWTWDDWAGSAAVFDRVGNAWIPMYRLLAGDGRRNAVLGQAVAYDGTRIAVGAPYWDSTVPIHERVYLYQPDARVGASMCAGDGSVLACPCGNDSAAGLGFGCNNAYNRGANLAGSGSVSVAADDLFLAVEHMTHTPGWPPGGVMAQLVAGTSLLPGALFGDGLRCAGGVLVRLGPPRLALSGGITWWGPGIAALGGFGPGETLYFQVWYRDPALGACGNHYNSSNALSVVFGP